MKRQLWNDNRILIALLFLAAMLASKLWDEQLLIASAQFHHPILESGLWWITSIRSIFMVLVLMPILFLLHERRAPKIVPLLIAAATSLIVSFFMKAAVGRRRPYGIESMFGIADSSFPSGHTVLAFGCAAMLSSLFPRLRWFWYTYAIGVGLGRIYLEVHYVSDVMAGALIGLCIAWGVAKAMKLKPLKPKPVAPLTMPAKYDYKTEFRRKILHMAVGVMAIALVKHGFITPLDLFYILTVGIIISFISIRYRIPGIHWLLDKFERKHTHPGKGAITFLVGVILAIKLFPTDIAFASILILSFGDGISALIGPFGHTKTSLSEHKLIEGTIAGIIFGAIAASYYVPLVEAIIGATAAMTVEASEIKFNNKIMSDNILVPLVAGTTIMLLRMYL